MGMGVLESLSRPIWVDVPMGMSASVKSPWSMTVPRERIDWNDIKDRIDLAAIATALFGPAPKRSGRRLLWPCPFHQDHDPSLAG